jgi:mannitol 2-dehydrogenase
MPAIIAKLADPDPHRVDDDHRGRLFHRSGIGRVQSGPSGDRRRWPESGDPKTVFGLIVAGLKARKDKGIAPFTVMSCDNIPGNGIVTANAVVGLARFRIQRLPNGSRPMSPSRTAMVDRITPATGRAKSIPQGQFRYRGQLAGLLRRVQAMGAGGQVPPPGGRRLKRSA